MPKQGLAFIIGAGRGHNRNIHSMDGRDAVVLDFGEN